MTDTKPDTRTMVDLAREALQVQDACNLSGVVHSFSRAITRLRVLLEAEGKGGTDNVNTHPVCVLWADKIASLTERDGHTQRAYDACHDLAPSLTMARDSDD